MWIALVFIAFVIPVLFILWREYVSKKSRAGKGQPVARKKEPVNVVMAVRSGVIIIAVFLPVLFLSDMSFSFFSPNDSAIKAAFKHTGKRVVKDCNEADIIKNEGEKYRKALKDDKSMRMNMERLSGCPRERFPVIVEVFIDGRPIIDKVFPATGLRKDMASYVYAEALIRPGTHVIAAKVYDSGDKDRPDYIIEETAEVKPGDVKLVAFDEEKNKLILE